jgi:hypothetical protein
MIRKVEFGFAAYLGFAQILCGHGAFAAGSSERALLQEELAARTPSNWQVHVSQRDDVLLAFVTPPYQEAFNLWYEPAMLREKMLGLCPSPDDPIWGRLQPKQSIAIEPTVGGKSADAMRLMCSRGQQPPA